MLDNHGIDIPSKDYEERYAKNGRQLVYLSIAGELSAMFVVSYMADPAVKRLLHTLTSRRITLLVRTCDPNITEELLASTFDLNGFYIEVLCAPAGRSYEGLVDGVTERESSDIVSVRGVREMLNAVAQCRLLRYGNRFITVLQSIFGGIGILLATYMAFAGALMHPFQSVVFMLCATVATLGSALVFSKS